MRPIKFHDVCVIKLLHDVYLFVFEAAHISPRNLFDGNELFLLIIIAFVNLSIGASPQPYVSVIEESLGNLDVVV